MQTKLSPGVSVIVPTYDHKEIPKKALSEFHQRREIGTSPCGVKSKIPRYSGAHVTARLARLFDEIMRCSDT